MWGVQAIFKTHFALGLDGRWVLRGIEETLQTLKYVFMTRLPAHTQELLRASADIDCIQTESILNRERTVVNNERIDATVDRQPQKKFLYPCPRRTCCFVLTALGPIIWLSTAILKDRGSALSQPSDVTDARKRTTSRQNVGKTEAGARCERYSRPGKNEN